MQITRFKLSIIDRYWSGEFAIYLPGKSGDTDILVLKIYTSKGGYKQLMGKKVAKTLMPKCITMPAYILCDVSERVKDVLRYQ